ncbi:MAG: hypothetical protein EGQ26_07265 [Clostridiales bacterium]|nr:hypothetical protein [Clostridiales bacterium]
MGNIPHAFRIFPAELKTISVGKTGAFQVSSRLFLSAHAQEGRLLFSGRKRFPCRSAEEPQMIKEEM